MAEWTGLVTSSTGAYSGLNTQQIINTIIQADSQPLVDLQSKVAADQAEISSYGGLINSLSSLNTLAQNMALPTIYGMAATSSNTSVLTATAGPNASAATYSMTVSQIAQAQSIYSANFSSETASPVANSGDVGFEIQVGSGTPVAITYDSTNNVFDVGSQTFSNSLDGVRDAINAAGAGVTASVINNGSGYQLVITSNNTGASNRLKVLVDTGSGYGDATGTAGINQLAFDPAYNTDGTVASYGTYTNLQQSMAGLDANLTLNGLAVTRSSNTITDLITGVTVNLLQTGSSTLSVANDNAGFTSQINSFISTYNTVMGAINGALGTQSIPGPLYGDSLTKGLRQTLYDMTTNSYNGTSLAALGITHDDNGNLTLNSTAWNAALAANPSQVLGAVNQMASSLQSTMNSYMNTIIPGAEQGLNGEISLYKQQEDQWSTKLAVIQQMLTQEFSAMEQTLSTLSSESTSMTNMLGSSTSSSSSTSSTSTSGGTTA